MYIVFTADGCKWCDKAKALLAHQRLPYTEFHLSDVTNRSLWSLMGFKTVPQVFDGPTHIGGFEALAKHLNT